MMTIVDSGWHSSTMDWSSVLNSGRTACVEADKSTTTTMEGRESERKSGRYNLAALCGDPAFARNSPRLPTAALSVGRRTTRQLGAQNLIDGKRDPSRQLVHDLGGLGRLLQSDLPFGYLRGLIPCSVDKNIIGAGREALHRREAAEDTILPVSARRPWQ
jgi:hypothetical protein